MSAALLLALLGLAACVGWAPWRRRRRARARRSALASALPDLLDLLAITVAAGLALDAALLRVTAAADGPAAEELRRLRQDLALGTPRRDALRALAERTGLPQLALFAAAVAQAESAGAPIADVLRSQAATQRAHATLAAEERAARLPVTLVVPLVLCILPALLVVVVGPAVVSVLAEGVLP